MREAVKDCKTERAHRTGGDSPALFLNRHCGGRLSAGALQAGAQQEPVKTLAEIHRLPPIAVNQGNGLGHLPPVRHAWRPFSHSALEAPRRGRPAAGRSHRAAARMVRR
ncbi:hypothetical protein MBA17_29180 [Streptosporangium sp. KLBMP 9127]|nr:hypothetical protein [Streptosporangium sp. KLBMP 9127]